MNKALWTMVVAGLTLGVGANSAPAQYYNSHHHHDAAGHRIDDYGHHIDLYGRHTGNVGVYDNGAIDYSRTYRYYPQYSYGTYPASPQVFSIPQNTIVVQQAQPVPQNVIAPQNIVQANPAAAATAEQIVITLPKDAGQDLNYAVNSFVYNIKPGFAQKLDNDRHWTIAFGSGGTKGNIRYTLSPGKYNFKLTDGGWDLQQSPAEADQPPAPPMAQLE
jgi:hypothetical protein